ncbi:MAG: c-type cytochrome [Archangium sp.]|nr:c-type cytochrome [Archangium sp.]
MRTLWRGVLVVALASCGPQTPDDFSATTFAPPPPSTPSRGVAPIAGGTLAVVANGRLAVVSDPDGSRLVIVELVQQRVLGAIALPSGSQPNRAVEDGAGKVHVILRGTGQVAVVAPERLTVDSLESVCAEPRGITWDAAQQRTVVACATGELVSRPLVGSSTVVRSADDLRDVMSDGLGLFVSRFRDATVSSVSRDGTTLHTGRAPRIELGQHLGRQAAFEPHTAWRTLIGPSSIVMVHQRVIDGDVRAPTDLAGPAVVKETHTTCTPRVVPGSGYYGGALTVCDPTQVTVERTVCTTGVVRSAVSVFTKAGAVLGSKEIVGIVPVDAALAPNGSALAVVSVGNHLLTRIPLSELRGTAGKACGLVQPPAPETAEGDLLGQPTGVAYRPDNTIVVHSRAPAQLTVLDERGSTVLFRVPLPGGLQRETPGHALFHTATKAVACVSCHPEADEDGHVWNFLGAIRRTQTLTGGLAATAPYHWSGDLVGMRSIVSDTYVSRMGGAMPKTDVIDDLEAFLDAVPARRAPAVAMPAERVEAGRIVFASAGCTTCHSGPALTNNTTVDVGTGGSFQVPSLVGVGARAPYMHNGCAASLRDRFTDPACGGSKHGAVAPLSPADIDRLVDYLLSL